MSPSEPIESTDDYFSYEAELQRAKDWSTHAGLHMSVIMSALVTTEACLVSASKSLDSEFARNDRLTAELDRRQAVVEAAWTVVSVFRDHLREEPELAALAAALEATDA